LIVLGTSGGHSGSLLLTNHLSHFAHHTGTQMVPWGPETCRPVVERQRQRRTSRRSDGDWRYLYLTIWASIEPPTARRCRNAGRTRTGTWSRARPTTSRFPGRGARRVAGRRGARQGLPTRRRQTGPLRFSTSPKSGSAKFPLRSLTPFR
jgi:hypothetical protein